MSSKKSFAENEKLRLDSWQSGDGKVTATTRKAPAIQRVTKAAHAVARKAGATSGLKPMPTFKKVVDERRAGLPMPRQADGERILGSRVRRLRSDKDWTLSELARRSGISVSTLSKVENHKISLAYDNIIKLARGLEVEVAELFAGHATHAANSRRSIARQSEGKLMSTPNYDYYYLSTDIIKKRMIPIYTRIKCRRIEDFGEFLQHSGEEFIYVLEGAIEVHTASYSPAVIKAGEGVYLDSTMPHAYISVGPEDAVVLGVCSSPEEPPRPRFEQDSRSS